MSLNHQNHPIFTMRCTIVQSVILLLPVVCLSVCPSVCDVGGSWPHRLKILETNCANNLLNIFALLSPKVIQLLPGEHGEILGRKCSFNTYVHNVRLNWVNRESCDLRWRFGCLFTFVGASCGHLCDRTAFLYTFGITFRAAATGEVRNFKFGTGIWHNKS